MRIGVLLAVTFAAGYQLGARRDTRAELMEADRAFDLATAERGVDGWTEAFAADGRMVRQGGAIVEGGPAIRGLMSPLFQDRETSLRWVPEFAEASRSGDLGYTVGTSRLRTRNREGVAMETPGRYVTIWRRVGKQWKVALDIGTSGAQRRVD